MTYVPYPYATDAGQAAEAAAKAAQDKVNGANRQYRDKQRAANAARRLVTGRSGNTAGDVAYRASANSSYTRSQREADAWNNRRNQLNGRGPVAAADPVTPPASGVTPPAGGVTPPAGGGGGGGKSGGSGGKGKVPTPRGPSAKPSYTRDMANAAATKKNTLLKRANAVYGDTRPGADNGEIIQGGASDPKNVTLSGKEFADFKAKFSASHKSSKGLSDRSLRVMARYMKSRGKGSQFGLPGAPAATPPAEG